MTALARALAAVALAAATGLLAPASPAAAAACSDGTGVTVVVDYQDLGGGVQSVCDPDGGGDTAATLFTRNGFALRYVQRQPGMVCRVDDLPADDPCVDAPPADAYWSLWWSDGRSGSWTYSSSGVGSLKIPDGGYVGFAWDASPGQVRPGLAPTTHASSPPAASPSSGPGNGTGGGDGGGDGRGDGAPTGTGSTAGTGTPAPTHPTAAAGSPTPAGAAATPGGRRPGTKPGQRSDRRDPARAERRASRDRAGAAPTAGTPSPSATAAAVEPASADAPAADRGGLPVWVAPALVVLLFAGAGCVVLVRRRGAVRP